MIPIAHPLADEAAAQAVLRETGVIHSEGSLVSGIRACQKTILTSPAGAILVLSATTSPMDLITHIPILCEENAVPYIFVPDSTWMQGFTCVLLRADRDNDDVRQILQQAHKEDRPVQK